MIRKCEERDFHEILTVINDGAQAYHGVIPKDRWKEPYMSASELRHEIADGVLFSGWDENARLLGVMGIQEVEDVCLIRHAYVRTSDRHQGIGSRLLRHFMEATGNPILIGTWADASWAIRFYEKHGFRVVGPEQKDFLLKRYWKIPARQIETSVVLVDKRAEPAEGLRRRGL
jgi:GNAT superfamily N-acetyltransferase